MSHKVAKQVRRVMAKTQRIDFETFRSRFSTRINSLSLRDRCRFAWSVVRGRVD